MSRREARWLRIATHAGALMPLAALGFLAWQDRLGPVPVAAATRLLGRYALTVLLLSLVPTVVRTITGSRLLLEVRRPLGLYAFLYAVLHVSTFAALDYGLDLGLIATTLLQSRRDLIGSSAFVILGALAVTSMRALRKALGSHWKRLHRLVYVAGGLVVLHYALNYKELRTWPLIAGVALAVLLVGRLPPVVRLLRRLRKAR